ncbi:MULTISPECIES: LysE family translocator [Methylobacterium]|jgi:threonine/homoserine/homoserine lactone efflux protein|uniref:LysE family translocator n=1 Tax=Methylobacterium TaxID=407 RepID=UPI0008E1C5FA|nr:MULTISPECIES: LysE family translocator [Methylobacterium]MBZ6411469.1 LysE family translocator [Methylobacterium sp.]MBK3396358.1 LysE family translocator [Methylobacterium ajmalii]MBK3410352.1 LysE family translocator [Methylobacterium ajmalii]MBK3423589.1 LysE family translocator [Methylobacterium ajmalii]SFE60464.1 Threonine/homoserine/homoserine lactone efflux protein [Methylobacterium sp. yr596]
MDPTTLLAFAAAFLVFAASPGPDNMTIVARTLSHGPAAGIAYGLGMVAGILALLVLAAAGLAVVAREMGTAMTVLRYAGAAYLVWTGIRLWTAEPVLPTERTDGRRPGLAASVLTGLALNLGSPKMPLFYLALLPNVVGTVLTPPQVGLLAAVIVAVEALVIGAHVLLAGRLRRLLRTRAAVRRANRAAGGVMVGAGVAVVAVR